MHFHETRFNSTNKATYPIAFGSAGVLPAQTTDANAGETPALPKKAPQLEGIAALLIMELRLWLELALGLSRHRRAGSELVPRLRRDEVSATVAEKSHLLEHPLEVKERD